MEVVKDVVFRRVPGVEYSMIKNDLKMFNIFLAVDGERTVETIAKEDMYELDYLFPIIDNMEKMGLLVPVDGTSVDDFDDAFDEGFCSLPKQFQTGIDAVDKQHQRLVDMVNQLDDVRKAKYRSVEDKQSAVGNVVSEMVDYTISHFAFEESLMEDAEYEHYSSHHNIHELLIQRAGDYKNRWASGEDIADELYSVLSRWLFNHIRNDDRAFAPAVLKRMREMNKLNSNWIAQLLKRFFK